MRAVPDSVPLTSDTTWHLSTQFVPRYRLTSDASQMRNRRATARLEWIGTASDARKSHSAKLMRIERTMDALRGKRVRVRAMIKADNLTGGARPFASAGRFDEQGKYTEVKSNTVAGASGSAQWLSYATTIAVPPQADSLEYGVRLDGKGTVWIDDIVLEVLP
jgi:hypothetical protein